MDNPLLDFSSLPRFSAIRPEHVAPAIDALIGTARETVERLAVDDRAPTWDNFVEPLDDANERLGRAWSHVSHLNAVVSTPELRDAYNTALPKVTQFFTEQGQDQRLYARLRALRDSSGFAALTASRKRLVENRVRDFRLGGAELPPPQKARFLAIQEELATLSAKFQDNVLDATNDFGHFVTDPSQLAGIPDDVLATAKAAAEKDGKPGWKLTLHMPCYMPVLQYADNADVREALYRGFVTRASEFGKTEWDNTDIIGRILALRTEAATLLGFGNYAEVSLFTKMAAQPAEALSFLDDLARRSRPFAERDMAELTEFARSELGIGALRACDVGYASEKLRQKRYAFSDQEVRQYFPEDTVLAGMFRVVETIYGVRIREARAETWHPSIRFFEIADAGGAIGHFYLDLYAREGKRGGAWMDEAIARRRLAARVQTPVATLTCNFSAPVGGKPALFTHYEVETLFHEFGHGLHQLLTQVDEIGVSGINGVEWDAVELPSQIMENFCWEWGVVQHMSRHVDSGQPLPRALFDRMLAAKNFQSGMQTVRQLEFGMFDMRLHAAFEGRYLDLLKGVRSDVAVVPYPDYNRFPNQFSHIFGGGYAAGYYSYKWAEVLSADAYSAFEEGGVLNPEVGARFRREVLAAGGSRPAIESFMAFRGRKPQIDALLRHNGMTVTA
ncbi:M3 family metallopeptidase [Usitatibacter palustris]|uniref:oligopeptidase A n=1 Tax=Usitatibacter palustris TaxID=2732487 RepID=A0A6M4HCS2_9PROT|nr:M3 family metallopeptidase [Usitatibacter palustris]QJR16875.1 Oligopeptidase A [Usitatibacter palustris]